MKTILALALSMALGRPVVAGQTPDTLDLTPSQVEQAMNIVFRAFLAPDVRGRMRPDQMELLDQAASLIRKGDLNGALRPWGKLLDTYPAPPQGSHSLAVDCLWQQIRTVWLAHFSGDPDKEYFLRRIQDFNAIGEAMERYMKELEEISKQLAEEVRKEPKGGWGQTDRSSLPSPRDMTSDVHEEINRCQQLKSKYGRLLDKTKEDLKAKLRSQKALVQLLLDTYRALDETLKEKGRLSSFPPG